MISIIDMIDIANGCAKTTCKSDFWRNRCVNHHSFLLCTQGTSEGLAGSLPLPEQGRTIMAEQQYVLSHTADAA
ncbi:MAG TPA: hypothetical protein VE970_19395, partial [Pseudolabrys sp.]|nr:hypothetical protein [Pseudolabrys sp.]